MFRYKRVLALQNYSMRGEIISMARIRVTEVVVPKIKPFILVCFQILRKVVFRIQKEMLNLVFELQRPPACIQKLQSHRTGSWEDALSTCQLTLKCSCGVIFLSSNSVLVLQSMLNETTYYWKLFVCLFYLPRPQALLESRT